MHPWLLSLFFMVAFNGEFASADAQSQACFSQVCGGFNISYPFWLQTEDGAYCGYEGFEIKCSKARPILDLNSDAYFVKGINYNSKTLTVIDTELESNACPRPEKNVSFGNSPLSYAPQDTELFFFFNCSNDIIVSPPSGYLLPCLVNSDNHSSYSFLTRPAMANLYEHCEEVVVVPILESAASDWSGGVGGVVDKGFNLTWGSDDSGCISCENSGGCCGYNTSTESFVCYCKDRPHSRNCSDGNNHRMRQKMIIIIVLSATFGTFLLAAFFYSAYTYKKKKRSNSLLLTRAISSEPSSKGEYKSSLQQSMIHVSSITVFTYEELEEATINFSPSKELGDGGFGTVYLGKLRDGRLVAIKRLYENNCKQVEQFMNEIKILSSARHPNLVCLYGCTSRHSRELLLVYEYMPNGTVADHLHGDGSKSKGVLSWKIRMSIAIETADALAYLHSIEPPIIHRDVKTNNILLDNNFRVKVADFGMSRLFPLDVTHVSTAPLGTPGYVDPDYHQCYQLTDKSDVYSFGVVLAELISGKPAVDIARHRHEINLATMAINKIQNRALHELVDPEIGFESDPLVKKMVTLVAELTFRCLSLEKDLRPTMEEVAAALRLIESNDEEMKKMGPEVFGGEEVNLLKSYPPCSPDSVTDKWVSRNTTPNSSS